MTNFGTMRYKHIISVVLWSMFLVACGPDRRVALAEKLMAEKETDSAASLRAAELNADILLKATMVDGIYDKDPKKFPDAVKYDVITHHDILVNKLQVMDSAAAAICTENNIPIIVFDLNRPDNIYDAVMGETVGTLVTKHKPQ